MSSADVAQLYLVRVYDKALFENRIRPGTFGQY
jgi:hypothetical protein